MLTKIKLWYYRKKAKYTLIARYQYLNEVNRVLEEYITERILAGGSGEFLGKSRSDLVTKQNEIREQDKMIEFLKRLK